MPDAQQLDRFENHRGFIAALDQSGGSTPKALRQYGVDESQYADEAEIQQIAAGRPDAQQNDEEFDRTLAASIESIHRASIT